MALLPLEQLAVSVMLAGFVESFDGETARLEHVGPPGVGEPALHVIVRLPEASLVVENELQPATVRVAAAMSVLPRSETARNDVPPSKVTNRRNMNPVSLSAFSARSRRPKRRDET